MARTLGTISDGGWWRVPLRQAVVLLLTALVLTAASWILRADRLPLLADPTYYELELSAPLVDMAAALELFELGDHIFLDTRAVEPGTVDTISGAFTLRAAAFDDDLLALGDILLPEDPLLLFGDGDLSQVSNIAARLQARGYGNLVILRGGLDGWRLAGGDISPARSPEAP